MTVPELVAEGSGYYRVYVDGTEVSQHTTERKAVERAYQEREANPTADVTYDHDYIVVVGNKQEEEEGGDSAPLDDVYEPTPRVFTDIYSVKNDKGLCVDTTGDPDFAAALHCVDSPADIPDNVGVDIQAVEEATSGVRDSNLPQ